MATVTLLGTQTLNTTTGTHTVAATPAVGDLIIIVAANTGYTGTSLPTDNNSDGLGTYTLITSSVKATSADTLQFYVRNSLVGSATSTTFSMPGASSTGGGLGVFKITGMKIAGTSVPSTVIRQSAIQSNQALSTTPTPVLGKAALTGNALIGAVFNATSPATMTPRGTPAYTEAFDVGYSTPTTGLETMVISSGETGTSIAWGGTSASAFCDGIVEINATDMFISVNDASTVTDVPVVNDGDIYLVQAPTATKVGSQVTISYSLAQAPKVGNYLVVAMASSGPNSPITSFTDNQSGNTYTQIGSTRTTAGGSIMQIFAGLINSSSGTFTLSATGTGGGTAWSSVFCPSEWGNVSNIDQTGGTTGTSTTPTTTSMTPSINKEILYAAFTDDAGDNTTIAAGTGYTLLQSQLLISTSNRVGTEFQYQTTAAAATPSFTIGTSASWAISSLTLQPLFFINVSDSSAVTDSPTVLLPQSSLSINVSDSSAVTESTTVSWPLMETLQDDFEFNAAVDPGKWSTPGDTSKISVSSGQLTFTSTTTSTYNELESIQQYNLTGSYFFAQLATAPLSSIVSLQAIVAVYADANNEVWWAIGNGVIQTYKKVTGTQTQIGTNGTYNSTTMQYFRIRESGGTIFFDYSADASTWTNFQSLTNPFGVTSMSGMIQLGNFSTETSTSTAVFDNINVVPGGLQLSWKGYTWNKRVYQGVASNHLASNPNNISGPDGSSYLTFTLANGNLNAPMGAELFSAQRGFGYGVYTAVVGTELDTMSHKVAWGGPFTFDYTAAPDYREIDIAEVRDYASAANIQILHSHAYNNSGVDTFITNNVDINASAVQTHRMIWTPNQITFDSFTGTGTGGTNYFSSTHTTNVPTPGSERVHFNMWPNDGVTGYLSAPTTSVVLRDFTFTQVLPISAVFDSSAVTESVTVALATGATGLSINVSDSSAVTDAITQVLETSNINTSDSSAVTEAVTMLGKGNINVSDSSTVTDVITQVLEIANINVSDSSAVTDVVTQMLGKGNINVSDSSTVTDVPTVILQIPGISVFDGSAATDSLAAIIEQDGIFIFESTTVTDSPTLRVADNITVFDSSTVTENVAISIYYPINVFDSSTVTDWVVYYDDTVFTSEKISVSIGQVLPISVSDASGVTDGLTILETGNINTSDTSAVTENITISEYENITVSDSSAVTDALIAIYSPPQVADASTVTDNVAMQLALPINVFDASAVTDVVVQEDEYAMPFVVDSSVVTDTVTMQLPLWVSVSDASAVTDVLVSILRAGGVFTGEDSAVTDTSTVILVDVISVGEDSVVTDASNMLVTNNIAVADASTVTDVLIRDTEDEDIVLAEASTVTDSVTMWMPNYYLSVSDSSVVTDVPALVSVSFISVSDTSTVTDNVAVVLPNYYVSTSDSSTVTDSATLTQTTGIVVGEDSVVTDAITVIPVLPNITINDASTVTDNSTVISTYRISVFDASTITDVLIQDEEIINISVADGSIATDAMGNLFFGTLDISVYERIGPYLFIFIDGRLAMQVAGNQYIFV